MKLFCVWEHNGNDSMVYVENLPGAFVRGASIEEALKKLPAEAASWLRWNGEQVPADFQVELVQEIPTDAEVCDGDSDALFESEKPLLSSNEYFWMKELALHSAKVFLRLYQAVPDKEKSCLPVRNTFYGLVPRTAEEIYCHTKQVNAYYFGEIGVEVTSEGNILECREKGFALLESQPDYLTNQLYVGSYDEK